MWCSSRTISELKNSRTIQGIQEIQEWVTLVIMTMQKEMGNRFDQKTQTQWILKILEILIKLALIEMTETKSQPCK